MKNCRADSIKGEGKKEHKQSVARLHAEALEGLAEVGENQGWNADTMLQLACDYIDCLRAATSFKDYLRERVVVANYTGMEAAA